MKRFFKHAVAVLALLALPSCLENETTISLNKDGSGTVTEKTLFGAQMVAMFEQMAGFGGPEAGNESPLAKLQDEEAHKIRAEEMGEGVTFEKMEKLEENGKKGVRVTYKFKDINKLKAAPGNSMEGMSDDVAEEDKSEPVKFTYEDGKLTFKMPQPEQEEESKDADPAADAEMEGMAAMAKQMMGDMKMSMKLVVPSGIVETNATFHEGDTITLMEMNMAKVMEKDENFNKFMKLSNNSDQTKTLNALKDIEGVKVEAKPEVTVTVK